MAATPDEIRRAAEIIARGGLVAFPTETVYGLGANALDPDAVARIFAAKGRPRTSPLIVHVSGIEMAQEVAAQWPWQAHALAERYWPGPLSMVLPKRRSIPDIVTAGLPTVGIRMPRHPVALELIRRAGVPIAAPSANPFTRLSPTRPEHVSDGLGEAVDIILEGGLSEVGIESTVVGISDTPVLLRPGAVSRTELEGVLGALYQPASPQSESAHASPGLHARHYQPRTPLVISNRNHHGNFVRVWWKHRNDAANAVQLPADPGGFAAALYDTLHRLDRQNFDVIQVEPVPRDAEWDAVRDRLRRAGNSNAGDSVI